ncbi:MAG TPA: FAD-dependent oxidoreductase [Thermoplasmata archaeon]|nr:FAD-dependent oxidoreductase [Thermoplasmata archaeon]
MSAAPSAAPKPTPPKLNPVRVPIGEEAPAARTKDFRTVLHAYTREEAVLEAKRCIQCHRPWCVEACPITQDCKEYIRLIADEDFDGAARVTLRDDPLASSLCKVCYRYCEEYCVVAKKGVPIAIRHLKRAALEFGTSDLVYVPSTPTRDRVAVVGAGPAGLMAAWELGVRGYSVTVFEREPEAGGLVLTIPDYRMTDADLGADLARFRDLDVTFVRGTRVGSDVPAERLLEDGYAAVVLALGTPEHRVLGVPGESLPGVVPALPFLREVHAGRGTSLGREILVVGGGDVAMDAVRSALRTSPGARVRVVYRRDREEMPADAEEVHGAEEEGIEFLFRKAPVAIVGNGRVEGLVVRSVELGPPDAGGRRKPEPVPGSETTIPCDTVVVAVGQRADLEGFPGSLGLRITAQGWPEGTGAGHATAVDGVYAVGGRSVVYAMGAAMEAIDALDARLRARRGEPPAPRPDPFGGPTPFHLPPGYTKPIRS